MRCSCILLDTSEVNISIW
ncbi:unnamed protein product [Nyctereutes procyonoides]|uniref:(raccoon dog) hypothetical protein n=1 Tax=Nyctereutes procyonoides TaxID=34880 RepID=A0A811Y6Y9_NYCPR|nr:unnamed protein product [Nyctereutes procyonoides]